MCYLQPLHVVYWTANPMVCVMDFRAQIESTCWKSLDNWTQLDSSENTSCSTSFKAESRTRAQINRDLPTQQMRQRSRGEKGQSVSKAGSILQSSIRIHPTKSHAVFLHHKSLAVLGILSARVSYYAKLFCVVLSMGMRSTLRPWASVLAAKTIAKRSKG